MASDKTLNDCACLFFYNCLLMFSIASVKGSTCINADPVILASSESQLPKGKYVLETVEHGSLNVISAKFEVCSRFY